MDRNDLQVLITKKPMAGLDMLAMVEKQLRNATALVRERVTRNPGEDARRRDNRSSNKSGRCGGKVRRLVAIHRLVWHRAFHLSVAVRYGGFAKTV